MSVTTSAQTVCAFFFDAVFSKMAKRTVLLVGARELRFSLGGSTSENRRFRGFVCIRML